MIRELYIYYSKVAEVWYLEREPRHILGGCRGHSTNAYVLTCIALL